MEQAALAQRASARKQAASLGLSVGEDPSFTLAWPRDEAGATQSACAPLTGAELSTLVTGAAGRHGLSPALVREVARQESGFYPCAVSPKGALGVMQLMPATQARFAVTDPFDARQSVEAGARLLRQLLDRYGGDLALALGAYNAGPARVDRAGSVPYIRETQRYVHAILARLAQ